MKEEVFLSLGPDWFLLFLQSHLHSSTTVLGLKLLLHFLSSPILLTQFKDGLPAGTWVEYSSKGVDIMMGECAPISRRLGTNSSREPWDLPVSYSLLGTCRTPVQ